MIFPFPEMEYLKDGINIKRGISDAILYVKLDPDGTVIRKGFEIEYLENRYVAFDDIVIIYHKYSQQIIQDATMIACSYIYMCDKEHIRLIFIDGYCTHEMREEYVLNPNTHIYECILHEDSRDFRLLPIVGMKREYFNGSFRIPYFDSEDNYYRHSKYFLLDNFSNMPSKELIEAIKSY